MAKRVLFIALAALTWVLAGASVARAASMICVVRVDRPVDDAILKRLHGQTSDLPLTLVRVPEPIEAEPEAAQARAATLAQAHDARAVVWFVVTSRGDITLFVAQPEARKLFVHHVDREAGSPSAMLETSSLIVREVLKSLLDGDPLGQPMDIPPKESDAPPRPPPSETRAPPLFTQTEPEAKAPPTKPTLSPGWRFFASFGARAVLARVAPSAALSQRIGLARGGLELGAMLTLGTVDVHDDAVASLLVRRHALGAFGGWRWALGEHVTAAVDVHSGLLLFLRSTRPRVPYLLANASRNNPHIYVGPEARIIWTPARLWPRISVGVGADFVVSPPVFSYEGVKGVDELPLWPVQPYFTAALELGGAP
jgi:hypothetical protein